MKRPLDYAIDYLFVETCSHIHPILILLQDINRKFDNVLDFGANACNVARVLSQPPDVSGYDVVPPSAKEPIASRIGHLTSADSSSTLLHRDADLPFNKELSMTREVLGDEETLPYDSNTFDAVLSSLSMHWINDLPSVLRQINNILKPDSPFIATMWGGDSLFELRTSLQLADQERRGGVSTHTSPLADTKDMSGLLQSAGYKLVTIDVEDIVVDYPTSFDLMQDLQAMGESNAVLGREMGAIQRDVLLAGEQIYKALHGNEDGTVPATFRLIYLIGWKESPDQRQPEKRGTGQINSKLFPEAR